MREDAKRDTRRTKKTISLKGNKGMKRPGIVKYEAGKIRKMRKRR